MRTALLVWLLSSVAFVCGWCFSVARWRRRGALVLVLLCAGAGASGVAGAAAIGVCVSGCSVGQECIGCGSQSYLDAATLTGTELVTVCVGASGANGTDSCLGHGGDVFAWPVGGLSSGSLVDGSGVWVTLDTTGFPGATSSGSSSGGLLPDLSAEGGLQIAVAVAGLWMLAWVFGEFYRAITKR